MRHLPVHMLFLVFALTIGWMSGCSSDTQPIESDPDVDAATKIVLADPKPGSDQEPLVDREPEPAALLGRIEVKVFDQESAEPLDFASVTLIPAEGHARVGQLTIDGQPAVFDDLPLGRYEVQVAYLGYMTETTKVELQGPSASIEARLGRESVKTFGAFTVSADAIMVEVKDTETVYTIGSEDLTDYAVDAVEEAVAHQSGVVKRDGDGSRPNARMAETRVDEFSSYVPPPPPGAGSSARPRREDPRLLATSSIDEVWILVRGERHRPAGPPLATPGGAPRCGTIVVPRPGSGEVEIPLESTDVHARIDGYVSSVDVRQRFHNPFDETIEAEYVFPLPHDAAVNDFVMVVGGRRIRGIIREREEARRIYDNARRQGFKASLLEQERPNVFRQKVANIEAKETIDVELHFFGRLPYVDGAFEFAFPLVVGPRFNPQDASNPIVPASYSGPRPTNEGGVQTTHLRPDQTSRHRVTIRVDLDAGVEIEDLGSRSHVVRIDRDGRERATIELSPNDRLPNKDFVLRYELAGDRVKSNAIVHRDDDGDQYFSLMLVPPADLQDLERAPVEFVFVVDCSGSMRGWPLEQAKLAMARALRQLGPDDTFQVIRFSERASALGPRPLPATPENVARAQQYLRQLSSGGGTHMIEGIKAALDFPHADGRMRVVTFMTDGFIGNEDQIFAAIAERIEGSRIFSFGVGTSTNRHLLEGMARLGRGAVAYMGNGAHEIEVVDAFFERVRHPALTDVSIDWGSMEVASSYPMRIPDLFVGRPVLLHGAFRGEGRTKIRVSGRVGAREVTFDVPVDLNDRTERPALPLLWARTRIQDLTDRQAIDPGEGAKDEGLQLALGFNLMSPWTSFVAVDGSQAVDDPATTTVAVPTPMPEGVDYDSTVGGN